MSTSYLQCFPDEKIYSLRELLGLTIEIETDAFNMLSGECLTGYSLAIREVQLALCKKQFKYNAELTGMEK